jgi:photosystem II stability/assembly factor-like uncharacterized protein
MKPRNIGPAGMSGRVTAIDVVNADPNIIYAGTASGGIWMSESGGIHWTPIFDEEATQSIGAIAINQKNPDLIWAGTGEGNPRNSLNGGYGIYKSLDGGKSWKSMGLENTRHIHRIIINEDNPDIVIVGAIGSPWKDHPERGIFRTTDGGKTWNKVLYINERTGAGDLVVDPSNPNKLFAAMWEHRRWPWTFKSGGEGSGLYVSHDNGVTWVKRTDEDGLPKGELGRIGLAIARSNPKIVYALVESKKNALYKSEDGGIKFKKINDKNEIGNRPFYYFDIFVDPINENRLYSLFSLVNVSEDGGKNFRTLLPYSGVHPDHHAWWIHPEDPDYIIEGNDGGLNISRDRGESWRFIENLPLAQFYHISIDNEVPYNVYGGMQDNGSWIGPAYVFKSGGVRNSYWQELFFGDGFDVLPDPDDSRYGYAMSQQGNVGRYDRETGYVTFIKPTHPDPALRLRFNWNAAIAQDPFDNNTIYYGSQFVHRSGNKGQSWDIISPDLTTNDPEKQKQSESGGLTMDATGAENHTTILAIEPSTLEKGLIWVGTDDGNVQITRDGGQNWSNITSRISGFPNGAWVPQIRASKYNAGEAFVVVNNYRQGDYKPYVFKTIDYGNTWSSIISESQVSAFVLSFIQDPVEPKLMFLGTDFGLYVSINGGISWTKWTNGYPSVPTADLAIHPREHDLIMGTFGRAAWVLDDIRPLREVASQGTSILSRNLHVFDAPDAYLAANQQAAGTRFAADAIYSGENRQRGARLSVMINKPEQKEKKTEEETGNKKSKGNKKGKKEEPVEEIANKKDDSKVKFDTLTIEVYNQTGEKIRTLKRKPKEDGILRFSWYMDEKGVRRLSRNKPRPNASEPGGVTVMPGAYKVVMNFGDKKDSTMVNVLLDPRLEVDMNDMSARINEQKELESVMELAGEAMNRLVTSKTIVSDISKRVKEKKGDEYKELKDMNKAMKDSIESLMTMMVGPDNSDRQGIVRSPDPTVNTYISTARRYLRSGLHAPGSTEERLIGHARDAVKDAIEKVNIFYSEVWPKYRAKVESSDLSPFKDYTPLEFN